MLPPTLRRVMRRIQEKPSFNRSNEEKDMLAELEFLDQQEEMQRLTQNSERHLTKIVTGPSGVCDCCGRPL